jgi:VanZ family protein
MLVERADIGQHASMTRARKTAFWLPALLWAGLIFFLSAQSKLPEIGPKFPDKDKVEHLVFYAIFWFCILLPLRYGHRLSLAKAIMLAFLITSAYGASDEFHQSFVPNRSCDVLDWAADTFGGFIAATAYWVYESHRSSKTNR